MKINLEKIIILSFFCFLPLNSFAQSKTYQEETDNNRLEQIKTLIIKNALLPSINKTIVIDEKNHVVSYQS